MRTCFIVVNYNGATHIERCLRSILAQTLDDFGIVVIDNASTDGSCKIIERMMEEDERISHITNGKNLGFAAAVNQGINGTDAEFIALVNNDAFLENTWLEALLDAARSDPDAGIFAPKLLLTDGRLNSTGHIIYHGFAVMDRGFQEQDEGQYDTQEYVPSACAAATLYRGALFDDVGQFDEDYFMYSEDVDMSLRALAGGWKVLFVPRAIAHHIHSATAEGSFSNLSVYYNHRNVVWTFIKDVPSPLIWWELPFFILRNAAAALYYLIIRPRPRAILCAKFDALKAIGAVLEKRRRVQEHGKSDMGDYIAGLGLGAQWGIAKGGTG